MTGTRFYDYFLDQLNVRQGLTAAQHARIAAPGTDPVDARENDAVLLAVLNDERCKRILFDSRQAATFESLGEGPPGHWQSRLHPPFGWFYLEMTAPISVGEQEPGHDDCLRAVLFRESASKVLNPSGTFSQDGDLANVCFVFNDPASNTITDRGFQFNLNSGQVVTRASSVVSSADPSQLPETIGSRGYILAGDSLGIEHRYIGWHERTIVDYSQLLSWLLVYMMAKGIKVVPEPVSRQQRRLYARKKVPAPWHIVTVEPRVQKGAPREEPVYHHGFRYDVMGHLRFGNHKLGDGTYRETIEWVRDHQRGLSNELYIPKTSKFEGGKVESPTMARYFTP